MNTNTSSPSLELENLVRFESTLKTYKVKSHIPVLVRFSSSGRHLYIGQEGETFVAMASTQVIHQLSVRIFPGIANDLKLHKAKWNEELAQNKESLELAISHAFRRNELIISYREDLSHNMVYGFYSDSFQPVNQLDFRNAFIEAASRTESLDLNSTFIATKYNIIEQFDFKSPKGRIKLSYLLQYARNNGYHGIKVSWGRMVIVCSNGLIRIDGGEQLKYRHLKTASVNDFVNQSLIEGIKQRMENEDRVDRALDNPLQRDLLDEFMNRLHLASVSKERVLSRLKTEIDETGNNEWALSQALTWLGSHDKHLMLRPKQLLTQAGSLVLDHSLQKFLTMDTYTEGEERAFGVLLPKNYFSTPGIRMIQPATLV